MGEEERVKAPKKTLKLLKYNLFLRLGCLHAPFIEFLINAVAGVFRK